MPIKRYEILLPLNYNDGREVEPEKFKQTRRELLKRFGALSFETVPIHGFWTKGERTFEDILVRIVIDVQESPNTRRFFQTYKEKLKKRFKQLEIWMMAYPIEII